MKTFITRLKILLGLKKAICIECSYHEYRPERQPEPFEILNHKCLFMKNMEVKTNHITGERKEFCGWCAILNGKGRCLGFKEVEKRWNE